MAFLGYPCRGMVFLEKNQKEKEEEKLSGQPQLIMQRHNEPGTGTVNKADFSG
jgi:hypothetical protein